MKLSNLLLNTEESVKRNTLKHMKIVDVFSGCGGFSLGAKQAGFEVVAAFDNNPILTSSYPRNFPNTRMILKDAIEIDGERVREVAGGRIDGIVGGPPCQGFSAIGKRDPDDPRRLPLGHFFRIVREVKPSFFVMENVTGLAYSNAMNVLRSALCQVDEYEILGPQIWNAADFGAATKRSRLFIIGIHSKFSECLSLEDIEAQKRKPTTVREAIGDLEDVRQIGEENGFDVWRIVGNGDPSEYARSLRSSSGCFTGHRMTRHSEQVVSRFAKVSEGGVDLIGRHPRLAWTAQSPAIRAGTGSDRGSYQAVRPIHPRHPRVITVREAARLQGFPDSHRFHPTIWHSFRMIGNSVSPYMAKAIFRAISKKFGNDCTSAAE